MSLLLHWYMGAIRRAGHRPGPTDGHAAQRKRPASEDIVPQKTSTDLLEPVIEATIVPTAIEKAAEESPLPAGWKPAPTPSWKSISTSSVGSPDLAHPIIDRSHRRAKGRALERLTASTVRHQCRHGAEAARQVRRQPMPSVGQYLYIGPSARKSHLEGKVVWSGRA
jgi:hypothetical protein